MDTKLGIKPETGKRCLAWNAFKNLADLVGNVRLTIEAHKADGFDQSWLQNALYEPLNEADVEVQDDYQKASFFSKPAFWYIEL